MNILRNTFHPKNNPTQRPRSANRGHETEPPLHLRIYVTCGLPLRADTSTEVHSWIASLPPTRATTSASAPMPATCWRHSGGPCPLEQFTSVDYAAI